ncbi:EF-P lysine aminoacylase GenX [Candidatus Uhrbacteria bacterium]|nr:EF-P lysine aminoacylase GenX [Candidatus Uhrbacteria bacterium]
MHRMKTVKVLRARAQILRGIREFFWARGFLEVETPVMLAHPSQEPYLEPLRTTFHDERGRSFDGFLRMSPEFSLKKLIASVSSLKSQVSSLFEIGPVFRDGEPWGTTHNPEFTMLEWYRLGATYRDLMEDCEALVNKLAQDVGAALCGRPRRGRGHSPAPTFLSYQGQSITLTPPWERLTMREAWKRYAKLDLDHLLGSTKWPTPGVGHFRGACAAMARACRAKGHTATKEDTFDDLFFKIHLTEVEPKLGRTQPTFLTDWPSQMAALARKKSSDPRYAERVELYIGGLEIANGFSELTDADEQLARFRADQRLRRKLGKSVYPIDKDFIVALRHMPPCAGIALGVDRLVMLLVDAATIDEVRWLPARRLFSSS